MKHWLLEAFDDDTYVLIVFVELIVVIATSVAALIIWI